MVVMTNGVSGAGRLVLVCGLPGAGKTTLARRLAGEGAGILLSPDDWMAGLGVNLWDRVFRDPLERLLWDLAQVLLRRGLTVVLDFGLWSRTERDQMRLRARQLGAGVELHYLHVPVDELVRRLEARNWEDPPITRQQLEHWATLFEAPSTAEFELFDGPALA